MAGLFLLLAPLTILYSRGYIFDLKNRSLVSTGGIFVKTTQPGVKIFIDSEYEKEVSFIGYGALIPDLLPRRYAVRVEKEGFRPWQKNIRVASQEVVEFRSIFLPPATISPAAVFSTRRTGPNQLAALSGRAEIALEAGKTPDARTVFIINPGTRTSSINLIKATSWKWDSASQAIIIGRLIDDRMRWFRLPLASGREEAIFFRGLPKEFTAKDITPHPRNAGEFYLLAGNALLLQGKASVPAPIADQVLDYAVTSERIYFITQNGFFVESNLDGSETKILGRKGLFLDGEHPAQILASPTGEVFVRDSAGGLFLYDPERDTELELVTGNILGVDFADDGSRALLWDDHRLWIYWLKDNSRQPFDLARTKKQIFYSNDLIRRAYLNAAGTYAFFSTESGVYMVESDDRGNVNSYDLVHGGIQDFLFDKNALVLYWTEKGTLYRATLQ